MKPFWPLLAPLMFALLIPVSSQADVFYRAFYKDPNVEVYYDRPSLQSFANIDPQYQRMLLAEMLTNPKDPASVEQKVINQYLPRLNAEDRAQVINYAFHLSVENGNAEQAKEFFSQATKSNPKLAHETICMALNDAGAPQAGDEFDDEVFAAHAGRVKTLLPLIAESTNPSIQTCDFEIYSESTEKSLTQRLSISALVAKASPDFKQQLEGLVREHSLNTLRKNKATSADLIQSFAGCTESQIITFFNHQTYPTFSQMAKGGTQYVLYQNEKCAINGIMKKVVVKNEISFQYTPSNGKFGYEKETFSFRSAEELASLLKTGSIKRK